MLKKAAFILSGNAFSFLMLFIRNLVIARLVSVEDYGVAATFGISMAVVSMASGLGLQQLIIQDKNGEDPNLQAGLQGFNLLRSILAAFSLFILAYPIALFLGIPDVAWAYQLLALVPLVRGFEHFDIHRMNRKMHFGPLIITRTAPAFLSLLSVWPLFEIFGDYRVMLYSLLLQWVLTLLIGHIVAERPFRLSFHREVLKKGFNFGWPLLVNNVLLFFVFQGDKLLAGRLLGMEVLAILSMGVTFTLTPTLVSASSERQFFLPQLSKTEKESAHFVPLALAAMQTSFMVAILLVLAISVLAFPMINLLLGQKYVQLIPLLPWLAVWQGMRTLKIGNTVVAMSQSQTSNAMIANSIRVVGLPVSWFVLIDGGTLLHLILVAIAAELCAYAVSLALVIRRVGIPFAPMCLPLFFVFLVFGFVSQHSPGSSSWLLSIEWLLGLASALVGFVTMRSLRSYIKSRGRFAKG